MALCNIYEGHLLGNVTSEADQRTLLRAAQFQCNGKLQESLIEYDNLTEASRGLPGVTVYKVRLMLFKGDFGKALFCLEAAIDTDSAFHSSPLDALLILMRHFCCVYVDLTLQEAVEAAREVHKFWLVTTEIVNYTDTFVLLEYYYQCIIKFKNLLHERIVVENETAQVLRMRRRELYTHLKSRARHLEALEVARMEINVGVSDEDKLNLLNGYLELYDSAISGYDSDRSFRKNFYEEGKLMSAAHVYLAIGKVYRDTGHIKEALQSFRKTHELFQERQSIDGKSLASLQVAILDKAAMVSPARTCQELQDLAEILIACEDWIGTNSAMAELSELRQNGPPSEHTAFRSTQLEIERIYGQTKNSFVFWHMQMQVWMLEFQKPTSFGKGIEMCKSFFRDNPKCSIRLFKDCFATMLSIAYQGLGDEPRAIKWAERCLEFTEEAGDPRLVIANKAALAGIQRKMWKSEGREKISQGIVNLDALFDEGNRESEGERVAECDVLVSIANYLADLWAASAETEGIGVAEQEGCLRNALQWIEQGRSFLPDVREDNRRTSRAALNFVEARIFQQMGKALETIRLCETLLDPSETGPTLTPGENADMQYLLANALFSLSCTNPSLSTFEKARDMYLVAVSTAERLGDVFMAAQCLKSLVSMCDMWRQSSIETTYTTSEILDWIKRWEDIWEEIRSESSVFRGLKGLQVRQRIREKNSATLYMIAIKLCIEEGDNPQAWEWVQRGKARAVADSLGLTRTLPSYMLQELPEEAVSLIHREEALLDEIDTTPGARYHLRLEHLQLRRQMNGRPDLRAIQAVRHGGHLNLGELGSMFRGYENVVCVDWAELEGEYWILTVRPGETPRCFATGVAVGTVRDWIDVYLVGEDSIRNLEDATVEDTLALEGLVAPLGQRDVTTDKDLLVFVPTGFLCSIPLHALDISADGLTRCILERNPVVYSNSLAILRQVLVRSQHLASAGGERGRGSCFRAAVFGDPTPGEKVERKVVSAVGTSLNADMFLGEDATAESFLRTMTSHNLIHYQGHAEFSSTNILQNGVLKLHDHQVNIHSLFDTPVQRSPHISLVACQSGQQRLSVGDEPIGFLTALAIAGAGSVLGTLWELDDIHASSVFTKHFYEDLATFIGEGKRGFVFPLAMALRKAVCAMRERSDTGNLYHWAPFILYGSPWLRFQP